MGRKIVIELEDFNENVYEYNKKALDIKTSTVSVENILSFGELEIDPLRRRVLRKKDEIFLTATEFDILFYLASYPDFVFTHRQIYEAIWKEDYVQDAGNVTAHIGHIRKKIEFDPKNPVYIQTVRGVGYKFSNSKNR